MSELIDNIVFKYNENDYLCDILNGNKTTENNSEDFGVFDVEIDRPYTPINKIIPENEIFEENLNEMNNEIYDDKNDINNTKRDDGTENYDLKYTDIRLTTENYYKYYSLTKDKPILPNIQVNGLENSSLGQQKLSSPFCYNKVSLFNNEVDSEFNDNDFSLDYTLDSNGEYNNDNNNNNNNNNNNDVWDDTLLNDYTVWETNTPMSLNMEHKISTNEVNESYMDMKYSCNINNNNKNKNDKNFTKTNQKCYDNSALKIIKSNTESGLNSRSHTRRPSDNYHTLKNACNFIHTNNNTQMKRFSNVKEISQGLKIFKKRFKSNANSMLTMGSSKPTVHQLNYYNNDNKLHFNNELTNKLENYIVAMADDKTCCANDSFLRGKTEQNEERIKEIGVRLSKTYY